MAVAEGNATGAATKLVLYHLSTAQPCHDSLMSTLER